MTDKRKSTLVLVHGLLGSLKFYAPERHLPAIKIIAPDLYGYGGLPLKADLSLQDQADFIKNTIENIISEPCWVLGHSVGGAIVNILASQHPELVKGLINVEGNFTLKDAFWCQEISKKPRQEWESEYTKICNDPEEWLVNSNITPSTVRISWAKDILAYQDAKTVYKMAKAVIRETASPDYKTAVNKIIKKNIPLYLVSGEHSVSDWDVPGKVNKYAKEFYVIRDTGHMMMLEKPEKFCELIQRIIDINA